MGIERLLYIYMNHSIKKRQSWERVESTYSITLLSKYGRGPRGDASMD